MYKDGADSKKVTKPKKVPTAKKLTGAKKVANFRNVVKAKESAQAKKAAKAKESAQAKKAAKAKESAQAKKAAKAKESAQAKQGADAEQGAEEGLEFRMDENRIMWIDFANMNMHNAASCGDSPGIEFQCKGEAQQAPFAMDDMYVGTACLQTPLVAPRRACDAPPTGVILGPDGQPRRTNACRQI